MAILREKTNTKSIPIYHRVARILREGLPIWKPLYLHKVVKGKEEKRGRKRERENTYLGQEQQISVQAKDRSLFPCPCLLLVQPHSLTISFLSSLHPYP